MPEWSLFTINITNLAVSLKSTSKCIKLIIMNQYRSAHIDTKNAIVFIIMQMKTYYDKKHQSHFFKVDDMINLWLHYEYILLSLVNQNKKLSQQFVNLLHVTKQIKKLVYHLNIFVSWQIHDVVFIVHLKLIYTNNSYQCSQLSHFNAVVITPDLKPEWELKQLLYKQTYWKNCDYVTEYLAQWMKYEFEYDSWINIKNLKNVKKLIKEFKQNNRMNMKKVLS